MEQQRFKVNNRTNRFNRNDLILKERSYIDILKTHNISVMGKHSGNIKEEFEDIVNELERFSGFPDFDTSWIMECTNVLTFMDTAFEKLKDYKDNQHPGSTFFEKEGVSIKHTEIQLPYDFNTLQIDDIDKGNPKWRKAIKMAIGKLKHMGVFLYTVGGMDLDDHATNYMELIEGFDNEDYSEDISEDDKQRWGFQNGDSVSIPELNAFRIRYRQWEAILKAWARYADTKIEIDPKMPPDLKLWIKTIELLYRNNFNIRNEYAIDITKDNIRCDRIGDWPDFINFSFFEESWMYGFHHELFMQHNQEQHIVSPFAEVQEIYKRKVITKTPELIVDFVTSIFSFDLETLKYYSKHAIQSNFQAIFNHYNAAESIQGFVFVGKDKNNQWEIRCRNTSSK